MAQELAIRGQGYPGVLKNLDVSAPLSGPFWSFEPRIQPSFILGANENVPTGAPALEFFHSNGVVVTPGPNTILAQTNAVPPNTWVLVQFSGWCLNADNALNYGKLSISLNGILGPLDVEDLAVYPPQGLGIPLPIPVLQGMRLMKTRLNGEIISVINRLNIPAAGSAASAVIRWRVYDQLFDRP